jgi:hypothetical protein
MPWVVKGLVLALKSKRGRELLFAGALGAFELARSDRARKVYEKAWSAATDPRPRVFAASAVHKAAQRVKRN